VGRILYYEGAFGETGEISGSTEHGARSSHDL